MTQSSPILSLPYLQPAQAQKHVTHNEALQVLDAVVQLGVASRTEAAPPAAAEAGARHILPAAATGAWTGQPEGTLAVWQGSGWIFLTPRPGWLAHVADEGLLSLYDGTAWTSPPVELENLPGLGIGTASDATNRLAVVSPASLFSHQGSDHRMLVNKAGAGDTASLLFQSGWSGRAEIGLAGDETLRFKVSADGSAFATALEADGATGRLSFPSGAEVSQTGTTAQGDYVKFACGTMVARLQIPLGRGDEFGSGTLASMYRTGFTTVTFDEPFVAPPTVSLAPVCAEGTGSNKFILLACNTVTATQIVELQALRSTTGTADITAHVLAVGRWN